MDERVSDFDDLFILFMKMEMKSCSRLGFKHQQNYLGPVFFMYLLTNTNIARIYFFMTQHVVVLLIMDMESPKSDVNGPKKKVHFRRILMFTKSDKNTKKKTLRTYRPKCYWIKQKNMLQKGIDQNCIIINFSFHDFKNGFCQIKSDFNLKSFFFWARFWS